MKLKEYIEQLQKLVQDRPETLELEVVYGDPDRYFEVEYSPTVGEYTGYGGDFHTRAEPGGQLIPNAVCIN